MNKMLVAVFENEAKAYEGLSELKSLHQNGDISLYASAVISKDANGKLFLKTAVENQPVGTATGLVTGSMLGLLGGPIGVAIGAAAGSLIGLLFDAGHEDVSVEFVNDVSLALTNSKTAVIAEIDEDWTVPVDTRLELLHAVVFRRFRYEVVDQQLERESMAIVNEFKALKQELKLAREEEKAKINAAIDRVKNKASITRVALENKAKAIEVELDGKVNVMKAQIKEANEKRKAKLQKLLNAIREEYSARAAKLRQASALISEALGPKPESSKLQAATA
jgi:uncharacterized membrane protein